MRTTLSSKQWSRIRGYVNGLKPEAKNAMKHRIETWEESVAKELAEVADGRPPSALGRSQKLDSSLVSQVAQWLKK